MRRGVNLTEGPIGRHLVSLGTFLALSVISVLTTSLVDVYFVAKLGPHPLAALSFTFPVVLITGAISMGLGNGVVAVVARAVGENDHESIRTLGTDAIILAVLIVMTLSIAGFLTMDPLFTLLGADATVLPLIKQYMHIWYMGASMQIIPQIGQSVIRGHGDTRTPGLLTATMCLTNMMLDPILIFGWGPIPAFGLQGAAIASISARVITLTGILSVLYFRLHALAPISFTSDRMTHSWRKLLHIGLPSAATQLVMPLSSAILTKIVALSGTLAVASYGVASRIETLTGIYIWAVAGALPAFVGQNIGAGRMDRVKEAVRLAIKFCIVCGLGMAAFALIAAPQIVARFTDDPQVQTLAAYYLRAVSLSYALAGIVMVASQTMNALARPLPASLISLCRTVVITVPCALVGQRLGQIHGVFIGIAIASSVCGAGAWAALHWILTQESARRRAAASPTMATA